MDKVSSFSGRDALVFNRASLLRQCMEERALAHNLLELYLTDLTPRATALRAALALGDRAAVQQVAHAIRGASLTVGAVGMARLTQDLENAGRRGTLPKAADVLPELEQLLVATRAAMERMLNEAGTAVPQMANT